MVLLDSSPSSASPVAEPSSLCPQEFCANMLPPRQSLTQASLKGTPTSQAARRSSVDRKDFPTQSIHTSCKTGPYLHKGCGLPPRPEAFWVPALCSHNPQHPRSCLALGLLGAEQPPSSPWAPCGGSGD